MTTNNIQQKILISATIALIILGIVFFSIIPNIKKINNSVSSITDSDNQRAIILEARKQTDGYEKDFSKETVYDIFVKKDAYKDFFNSIYDLAEKYNLECEVKYSGDSTKNNEKKQDEYIMINIQTKGDFNNSMLFLEKIENHPFLFDILEYKISKQTDGIIMSTYNLKVYANS